MLKFVFTTLIGGAIIVAATAQSMPPSTTAPMSTMAHAQLQIKLLPQNGSGESGTATLMDGEKGLIVKLRMTPAATVDQPAHIHKGTCDKLDPKPTYPLKMVHGGVSETTVPDVTIAMLEKSPFAINVHKSAPEAAIYVSCGNIVAPK